METEFSQSLMELFPQNMLEQRFATIGPLWIFNKDMDISPNFPRWEFCRGAQFPQSFGRIAQNSAETLLFYKIPKKGN